MPAHPILALSRRCFYLTNKDNGFVRVAASSPLAVQAIFGYINSNHIFVNARDCDMSDA